MKHLLFIGISLIFGLETHAQIIASTSTAEVHIQVTGNSGPVHLKAMARLKNIHTTQEPSGQVLIESARFNFADLQASTPFILCVLKKERFLDAEQFPLTEVSEIQLFKDHTASGLLTLKGIQKKVYGRWAETENQKLELKLNLDLSEFNVATNYLLFKINRLASVLIRMKNPYADLN